MHLHQLIPQLYLKKYPNLNEILDSHFIDNKYPMNNERTFRNFVINKLVNTSLEDQYTSIDTYIMLVLQGTSKIKQAEELIMKPILQQLKIYYTVNETKTLSKLIKCVRRAILKTAKKPSKIKKPIPQDFETKVSLKLSAIRNSASRRGLEFNLERSDIEVLLKRKTCYYTGARFSSTLGYTRTFERLDNTKGYVKGNVVPVIHKANQMKSFLFETNSSTLTPKQLLRLVQQVDKLGVY